MHPKQGGIIALINNYQLADTFAALDKLVLKDASYNTQMARLADSLNHYIEEYEPSGS